MELWAVPLKQRGGTGSVSPHQVPSCPPAQARQGSGEGTREGATQGIKGWKPCGPSLHGLLELSKRLKMLSIGTSLERRNLTEGAAQCSRHPQSMTQHPEHCRPRLSQSEAEISSTGTQQEQSISHQRLYMYMSQVGCAHLCTPRIRELCSKTSWEIYFARA